MASTAAQKMGPLFPSEDVHESSVKTLVNWLLLYLLDVSKHAHAHLQLAAVAILVVSS